MKKILIIDDHPLFRESLSLILQKLEGSKHVSTIYLAESAVQSLKIIDKNEGFDLILCDIDMPGMDGLVLLQQLRSLQPHSAIVMISGTENIADIQKALRLGAKGFIQKNSDTLVMIAAIQLVLAGGIYLPPVLLHNINGRELSPIEEPTLTQRQMDILGYLKLGMQNKLIAHQLDLSEATVKVHVRHIFSVLGVKNRTQAVQKAQKNGML